MHPSCAKCYNNVCKWSRRIYLSSIYVPTSLLTYLPTFSGFPYKIILQTTLRLDGSLAKVWSTHYKHSVIYMLFTPKLLVPQTFNSTKLSSKTSKFRTVAAACISTERKSFVQNLSANQILSACVQFITPSPLIGSLLSNLTTILTSNILFIVSLVFL
jgi:hypothetical protein